MSAQRLRRAARPAVTFIALILVLVLVWEGYKALGQATDNHIPFTSLALPLEPNDYNMPHLWDIIGALFRPSRRNGPILIGILIKAALFTSREAVAGFVIGGLLGFALGVTFAHSSLLERSLLPYVVASQTVPLLAIAPMVVIWLRAGWISVAVISAYLTFFPVTINTLRGLRSTDPMALELMRSYAATRSETLWKLRVPAAMPYVFTALKVSATASVVGAIIGELPSGMRSGLGGAILNFNQYYLAGPPKLWATNIIAALVGIAFFTVVSVIEALVVLTGQRDAQGS